MPEDIPGWFPSLDLDNYTCRHGYKGNAGIYCGLCMGHSWHAAPGAIVISCPVCVELKAENPDYKPPTSIEGVLDEELAPIRRKYEEQSNA